MFCHLRHQLRNSPFRNPLADHYSTSILRPGNLTPPQWLKEHTIERFGMKSPSTRLVLIPIMTMMFPRALEPKSSRLQWGVETPRSTDFSLGMLWYTVRKEGLCWSHNFGRSAFVPTPEIITVIASAATEITWPPNLDITTALLRLRDTFMGCFQKFGIDLFCRPPQNIVPLNAPRHITTCCVMGLRNANPKMRSYGCSSIIDAGAYRTNGLMNYKDCYSLLQYLQFNRLLAHGLHMEPYLWKTGRCVHVVFNYLGCEG